MAYFQAILVFGIGSNSGADSSDSNQNEPEPEPHKLVAPKEPKSDSKADSKAGITAALVHITHFRISQGLFNFEGFIFVDLLDTQPK